MRTFRAFIAEETAGEVKRSLVMNSTGELPKNHVLIKVKYSCLNNIDLLVLTGDKAGQAKYPVTAGVDASGIVEESNSPQFQKGDEVIVTGYGLGQTTDGGLGQYICVPESWPISLPTGLTLRDAMTIGTEGLAAGLAVMELLSAGIGDNSKKVLITGASMGTGAFATGIMSLCGYKVTAVTSHPSSEDFIKSLGAEKVIKYEQFIHNAEKEEMTEEYACAIETFGGDALKAAVLSLKQNGSVALCNGTISQTATLPLTSIISKGVNILGINPLNCDHKLRLNAWYNLAGEWYLKTLPWMCNEVSILDIEEYTEKALKNDVTGRVVVNHEI